MRIASSQFSYRFGKQLYLPYATAILVAYLKQSGIDCEFLPTAVVRPTVHEYAKQQADVLLCSCYTWNWEITRVLIREFKQNNPESLVIVGGPQLPNECASVFEDNPDIDLVVHGEGEIVLLNAIGAYLAGQPLDGIKGLSTRAHPGWIPESLIKNLDDIPSPYLDGTMESLVDLNAEEWLATWETMRGCQFGCAYCSWGQSSHSTIRKYSIERLYAEIDWFSRHEIGYIECADSNFGMFKRDAEIARYAAKTKKATGYPKTLKPSWAKKMTPLVVDIAKELKDAGLLSSVGCSLQSLDETALKTVHRNSVPFDEFVRIINQFKREGTQCFTEIIRGLPGETLESFRAGLDKIVFESDVDTIYIYNCSVLENTDLKSDAFDKYRIETIRSPIYFAHSSPDPNDITEYADLLVGCTTFTRDDIEQMYLYSWYILAFQQLGILNYITRYLHNEKGISYQDFFKRFEAYCKQRPNSLFGREYTGAMDYIKNGYDGNGWNQIDPALGPIVWPIDEATWLRATWNKDALRDEMRVLADDVPSDLIEFHLFTLMDRDNNAPLVTGRFQVDWKTYFLTGEFCQEMTAYEYDNKITSATDDFDWNTQAIWYGRRQMNYRARLEDIRYAN